MRFDGHRYVDCRWCGGKGCLYCEAEADAEYKRQFPDGPKPIATFTIENAADFRDIFGPEALKKAFGPDGGGLDEIDAKLRKLKGSKP